MSDPEAAPFTWPEMFLEIREQLKSIDARLARLEHETKADDGDNIVWGTGAAEAVSITLREIMLRLTAIPPDYSGRIAGKKVTLKPVGS